MAREILMPKLGLTMLKGKLMRWHVKEGDEIHVGDALFDVETDKLTNTIDADTEGVLVKIFLMEGETASVKDLIGIIAQVDENVDEILVKYNKNTDEDREDKSEVVKNKKSVIKDGVRDNGFIKATPYARKIAKEKGIDLSLIQGSGKFEEIVVRDIDEFKGKIKATPTARVIAAENNINLNEIDKKGRIYKADVYRLIDRKSEELDIEYVEVSEMRKIISQRMKENCATIPMVTYNMEVDMTEFIALRKKLKPFFEEKGLKLTYNHMVMKIAAKVLGEFRELNAYFDGEKIEYHKYVNMGIAVRHGDELLVPNVKNLEKLDLYKISEATEEIIQNAREGGLKYDDLTNGTFTITNIGMFEVDSFNPIINKPEVAILGLNRIVKKAIIIEDEVCARSMMNLSLTTDHSIIDGAKSSEFLRTIKRMIENPFLLLV